jgi:hypothetical protein
MLPRGPIPRNDMKITPNIEPPPRKKRYGAKGDETLSRIAI